MNDAAEPRRWFARVSRPDADSAPAEPTAAAAEDETDALAWLFEPEAPGAETEREPEPHPEADPDDRVDPRLAPPSVTAVRAARARTGPAVRDRASAATQRIAARARAAVATFPRTRLRERRNRWRPLLAGAIILLLAVATVVTVAASLQRSHTEAVTPPARPGALFGVSPTVDVVLDDATLAPTVATRSQWPALLATAMDATVRTQVGRTASFTAQKKGDRTFLSTVPDIDPDANLVVLMCGGDEGDASSLAILAAATRTIAATRGTAPAARIVLVGPLHPGSASPSNLPALMKNAAMLDGATWIDPADWLKGSGLEHSGEPTAKGEKAIAARLKTALTPLLR